MRFSCRWYGCLSLAVFSVFLLGCSQSTSPSGSSSTLPKTIGFSQKSVGASWRIAQTNSIKTAITGQGTKLLFDAGDNTQATQISAVQSFISQKADLIVLDCIQDTGWDAVLGQAKSAGIPVVFADTAATVGDSSLYASFVGSDFENEGKQVAIALSSVVSSGSTILELLGPTGNAATNGRKSGFETEIAKHGTYTLVSLTCNFDRTTAQTSVATYLGSHATPVAVFSEDDEMALGAMQALGSAGVTVGLTTTGGKVVVASINGEKEALQAVKNGALLYTFDCNPLQGPTVVDVCNKIYANASVAKTNYMSERGYYQTDVTDALIAARSY